MNYRTKLYDTSDGTATFGIAERLSEDGVSWREIGRTNNFRVYPRTVRARAFAEGIIRRYHTSAYPGQSFNISDI